MVYLPGHFLHLLNCSTELEPCHHIILQGNIIINKNATQTFQFKCAYINGDIKMPLLSGDAVPKFSSDDSVPNEPRLLLYLNKELSTSTQTG